MQTITIITNTNVSKAVGRQINVTKDASLFSLKKV